MPIVDAPRHREFVRLLRQELPPAKASHCVFVAEYLSSFAPGLGLDNAEAVTAGLLHDLCRTLDNATMLARAREYGIDISEAQAAHPNLLHGPVAAARCRHELRVDSPAVCDAIHWHTTGRPGLGRLGQALYVADFAEPTRPYPEAAAARELLRKEGFDEALYFVAHCKRAFFSDKGVNDPLAEGFYLWVQQAAG